MAEWNTNENLARNAVYIQALVIKGGYQAANAADTLHQRTVVTSQTQGCVVLRYAPHTPKATESVDTNS